MNIAPLELTENECHGTTLPGTERHEGMVHPLEERPIVVVVMMSVVLLRDLRIGDAPAREVGQNMDESFRGWVARPRYLNGRLVGRSKAEHLSDDVGHVLEPVCESPRRVAGTSSWADRLRTSLIDLGRRELFGVGEFERGEINVANGRIADANVGQLLASGDDHYTQRVGTSIVSCGNEREKVGYKTAIAMITGTDLCWRQHQACGVS